VVTGGPPGIDECNCLYLWDALFVIINETDVVVILHKNVDATAIEFVELEGVLQAYVLLRHIITSFKVCH
jgi:hypothetical protein